MSAKGTVTIIGSMRFWDDMVNEGARLHSEGKIVLLPFPDPNGKDKISDEQKHLYDNLIREMIDMSTEVLVINKDGYIGKSVRCEIEYAKKNGKIINYIEERKHKIITLCGSGRFKDTFHEVFIKLTKEGHTVLTPAIFEFINSYFDNLPEEERYIVHEYLDHIHEEKMNMSDEILVINKNGYIGEDTSKEISYAESKGIKVTYLEDISTLEGKIMELNKENENGRIYPCKEEWKHMIDAVLKRGKFELVPSQYITFNTPILYTEDNVRAINEYASGIVKKYINNSDIILDNKEKMIVIGDIPLSVLSFLPMAYRSGAFLIEDHIQYGKTEYDLYHNGENVAKVVFTYPEPDVDYKDQTLNIGTPVKIIINE